MEELKKKSTSTGMEDENNHDNLINLNVINSINTFQKKEILIFIFVQRLKDGYASIVDKMGYVKFKPYLQRLFHSVEIMLIHEETEFKKIDAKYQ